MDAVKSFNAELSALYDVKPPISKAKMNSLTRGAIKAIKFYKHVVQSVEKFIQKCKAEYKVPGLYVIDSIVRQSRHQFGMEKDVFAPRFAKNMQTTFLNLLKCPQEDKSKVIRVLNLWQKNAVFPPEVIQPLFDLADPNHPIHKEQPVNSNGTLNTSSGNNISNVSAVTKTPPSTIKNTVKDSKLFSTGKTIDPVWLAQTKVEAANIVNANKLLNQSNSSQMDPSIFDQLQCLQQLLLKKQDVTSEPKSSVKFDKKLLDFDYGEEEDDDVVISNSPNATASSNTQHNTISTNNSLESLGLLLANPEVLRQLQTLQQTMQSNASSQHEMEEKMRKLQQMKQQEEEFDKHLAQTVPNLPFASECELKPSDILKPNTQNYASNVNSNMLQDMSQPPPGYPPALPFTSQSLSNIRQINQSAHQNQKSPLIDERQETQDYSGNNTRRDSSSVEIVNCENTSSQSRSPERYRHHSRSRSPRHRDRDRDRDRDRKSRSRSRSRRRRSRSRDRGRDRKREDSREKLTEEEREKERERRKRGLPPIVRDKLSVCSTTLWVGHLSKLVHQEELSDTFGELGDIVSIDLISPRGCAFICMNRRQDAYRALTKLKNHKMQGKAITLAWAPGKGVKGKEWKDYWEVELGVSYIPWNKLINITDQDLELLEEGGMIDEDTLPPYLKGKLKHAVTNADILQQQLQLQQQALAAAAGAPIPTLTDGIVNVIQSSANSQQQQQQQLVDTSQPPPIRPPTSAALLPPPNTQLQMMPPAFTMPGVPRMISHMGLQMTHGLMPNVPIGVPPPNMQSLLGPGMMQTMLTPSVNPPFGAGVGVSLLTQIPMPAPAAAPSDKPNSTGMPHNVPPIGVPPPTTETNMPNLPMLRQPYGVGPAPPMQMQLPQQHHSDDMDVEMEDAMPQNLSNNVLKDKQPNLSDQLIAAMNMGGNVNDGRLENDQAREYKERERDRENRERRDRNERDRGDRMDVGECRMDRSRDRGRGRDRGRDRRRDNREGRDRERDERRDRENRETRENRDSGARHSEGLNAQNQNVQENESMAKKEGKPSLADRLRQLADGTLPLDDRMDRNVRGNRTIERSNERTDRNFEESPGGGGGGAGSGGGGGGAAATAAAGGGGAVRRPLSDMPISLMDLPKFSGVLPPDRTDFPRGPDFRGGPQDAREFPQRGLTDRSDRQNFPPRSGPRSSQMDDFLDPRMQSGIFPEDYEGRLGHNGPRPDDFPPARLGPTREEFERPEVRSRRPPVDEYERERFEYEIRRDGFDPRMQDGFDPRGHNERPDFDPRRREFFGPLEPVFGMPPLMGPKGPRGPDGFGPRGSRGPGPLMFHPRGMGPRSMRPGMRPPFAPRGPPFDPREADSFFRPPFDEMRGRPGPHIRPPFGPIGPPVMHGPDGLWRNQESGGGPPPASWSGQDPDGHGQRENHLPSRDKQKLLAKHQDYKNISENRNRNRKSRWGNISPPLMDDEIQPSEDAESKTKAFADGGGELEAKGNFDTSSSTDQHDLLMQREQELTAREQDAMRGDVENELGSVSNEGNREASYRNDENRANIYEIDHADHFPNNDLALKQQEQCEYETPIPAENSAQQSAVQPIEQIGHLSENYSDQSVEQVSSL
ncbi:protein SCAF8 [Camponotus floridanus]|uniref:protein SCAF8 n=1 Tax=Camponotus floridanus TaxID=104421 RepID=UPI00059B6057|nr:protein SCAF8 [Camponotus floridanus]